MGNDYPNYITDNDFHCQGSMLYERNSSIEPTSSTLLLQLTPSESGSYTTDEYSYRRTNTGNKPFKNQTIERNKKNSKKSNNYNNGSTLCSKSSTVNSQIISEHSKSQLPNKSNMFLLNEMSNSNQDQDNSPPSPAPFFNQNSSQRVFTTINNNQSNNYNLYESTFESNMNQNLYGGINRVLGTRQHHTLNTRQSNQQQRKNQARPVNNRVLDFIELNSELSGNTNNNTVNLISNPLHHNNSLQGSLPSLINAQQQETNGQTVNAQQSMMNKKILLNTKPPNRVHHQLNNDSNLNRSSSSLVSESDNFYCDIEEAQRVQSEFRAKLNANQIKNQIQTEYSNNQDSDDADDLVNENDKLIGALNRDENKLIVHHRRNQDEDEEDDELLTDQYSDYECIDRVQTANVNRFGPNGYLRQNSGFNKSTFNNSFNNTNSFNQRLTPINMTKSNNQSTNLNEVKPRAQFNLSLARNNQFNQLSNSQPGLFRYRDNSNGTFNTMQSNSNNSMR